MHRTSLERFLRIGTPCLWSGHDQVLWRPVAHVLGCTFPRRPAVDALSALSEVLRALVASRSQAPTVLFDVTRVQEYGCDSLVLETFRRSALEVLQQSPHRLKQLLFVGGRGISQCALLGAVAQSRPNYSWSIAASLEEALQAIDGKPVLPKWGTSLVGTLHGELTPLGIVSRVRSELGLRPSASLQVVARNLGTPPRTLQRALANAATTFANERTEVRLEIAAVRLERTEQKLSTIAAEVGYMSASRFLAVFTNRFGVTPGQFRKQYSKSKNRSGSR